MIQTRATILLAEDDYALASVMKDALEDNGYKIIHCQDGQLAIDKFDKNKFDICLLDIMMPDKDGFAVAKKIRRQSDVMPILFISTRAQEDDKIKGYKTGADDYITKPFGMQELLMKIEVFLRRTKKLQSATSREFQIGRLKFYYTEMKIEAYGISNHITQKEAELLKFFCLHPNKLVRREEVLLNVWGKDDFFLGRSMDVYVTKLRKSLKGDPEIILETIHGIGYRFILPNIT
ncbi:MAG: response regulator transcription factor [Bacteroidota bacterium]|nr:response regulator transcription factor [Bacteroidota bacterium]